MGGAEGVAMGDRRYHLLEHEGRQGFVDFATNVCLMTWLTS
jgi:hypothetical protein